MAKSSLEKNIEKLQKKEMIQQRAASIIAGQPMINNMRIMDDTAEVVLECLLNLRKTPEETHIRYDTNDFPNYLHMSLSLEMEKLIQYGMVTMGINWMGGGMLDLLPPAIKYFEKKNIAIEQDKTIERTKTDEKDVAQVNNKVFIVHGHDNEAKQEMARTLEKAGFEAIILHEQADGGDTIIEKIERYTDVAFAVVLYTECDYGRAKEKEPSEDKFRARQNVVFEHGYLIGKLSRKKVCAIVKGNIETPGDISGVVYTPMDENGAWKVSLAKNMRDAGLLIDFNQWM